MNQMFMSNIKLLILFSIFEEIKNTCSLSVATKASECLKETTQDDYCCFISPLEDSSSSMCYPYAKDKYFGYLNINHNKKIYAIDCGLGSTFMDSNWNMTLEDRGICGSSAPNDEKDCNAASVKDNSCCYYEGEDMKGCYWLGIKFTGKVSKNKYTFICGSEFFKSFKILFIILIILIGI